MNAPPWLDLAAGQGCELLQKVLRDADITAMSDGRLRKEDAETGNLLQLRFDTLLVTHDSQGDFTDQRHCACLGWR